jgi:hypothetical protein
LALAFGQAELISNWRLRSEKSKLMGSKKDSRIRSLLASSSKLGDRLITPPVNRREPGCGKTEPATAITYEFAQKHLKPSEKWPYAIWNINSFTVIDLEARCPQGNYETSCFTISLSK